MTEFPGRPLAVVENYFNYFTEIEEHYLRRRGTHLLLSTLDWALIETWKSAGVPLLTNTIRVPRNRKK